MPGGKPALLRQWRIIQALQGKARGMTVAQLCEVTGASRPTTYRDLGVLRDAGIPLVSVNVNGEARHRLAPSDTRLAPPTETQLNALRLARVLLAPLTGSSLVSHFEALLGGSQRSGLVDGKEHRSASDPETVRALERSLERGRRVRFEYRGTKDQERQTRVVDPLALRLVRDQLYFIGVDLNRSARRTFKVPRVSSVCVLKEKAGHHAVDLDELFANSVRVWDGETIDVVVRLTPQVARFAREWPLHPEQRMQNVGGGSVLVRAQVAGIEETLRWVLSWGRSARAEAPPALVDAVRTELMDALGEYEDKSSQGVRDNLRRGVRPKGPARVRDGDADGDELEAMDLAGDGVTR